MANELVNRYAQLAGQVRGRDRAEAGLAQRSAKVEMRNEIDRQRKERKAAEDEERKGWWKQLIPGAAGLAGGLVGMGLGSVIPGAGTLAGGMVGQSLGGMLGSGIAAKQGVPGAGAAFNQFSPMMMNAMMNAMGPDQFADRQPGDSSTNLDQLRSGGMGADWEYGDTGIEAYRNMMPGAAGSPSKSYNPSLGFGLNAPEYQQDVFGRYRF